MASGSGKLRQRYHKDIAVNVPERIAACRKRLQHLDGFPLIASGRLLLRAPRTPDIETAFELFSNPEVMRYWSRSPMTEIAEAERYLDSIAEGFHSRKMINWIVADVASESMLGTCTLYEIEPAHLRSGVGYALLPRAQGHGFASEAVNLAVRWAFEHLGMHRVEADVHPDNLRSRSVLERCGFTREGVLRDRFATDTEIQHSMIYGRLATDSP
jgi:RimJ/RimL family protein N-acetyltransferase